ncbi:MAG TPA: hypothetical protein VM101_03525 [Flavitalea sp.]|nr:hypothetical protein [Flavitalea sp.]
MKAILSIIVTILVLYSGYAQSPEQRKTIDSFRSLLSEKQSDTLLVLRMAEIAKLYGDEKPDSLLILSMEPLLLAKKIGYQRGIALLLSRQAGAYAAIGNKAKALELYLDAIRISEKINDLENLHWANNGIGNIYSNEDPRKALVYHWKAKELAEQIGSKDGQIQVLYNIGGDYRKLKVYDSAKMYTMTSFDMASALNSHRMMGAPMYGMGMIYTATDQPSLALEHFRTGAFYCESAKNYNFLSRIY